MKITKESIFLIFCFFFSLIPFVAFQWKWDGYELPKYLFVILFGVISGLIILLSEKITLPNKYLKYFLILFTISVLFSENYLYSFFGDYPRLDQSLLLLLSIFLISIVFISYIPNFDIFKIIFIQSIFLNLITLFENNERVFSTLGQPNYLGIILVLGIIYSIENSIKKKIYLIAAIFLMFGLIKTASITSILSLFIYLTLLIIRNYKKYWKYFLLTGTTLIILLFTNSLTKEKFIDNYNLFFSNKETRVTDSIMVRFSIWEDSFPIINESFKNFLIGTGPETFSLKYEMYRGRNINHTSEWNSLIDKSHNYYLELLIEEGILILILFIFILIQFFKTDSKDKNYMIVILIYLFFNWAHIFLQLIFFLILVKNLKDEKEIRNNLSFKSLIIVYILLNLLSLKFFKFEEMADIKNYYQTQNPFIKLEGIKYYQNKNDLKHYLKDLKVSYPNNLKINFEIYKSERINNFPEHILSKNKIKELRPDLLEWNEYLK